MGTPVHLVASRGPSPGFQESHDRTEPLLECLQARNEHAVTYLGDHLVLVRFVAVELRRPLDIRVITKCDRTGDHRGNVPADRQPGGVVAERERDGPVLVVEADQGLPVIAWEREDPDAPDPVGRPVLDLARRQRRVPASDGGEVSQQGPHLADWRADHGAREYLRHVNLLGDIWICTCEAGPAVSRGCLPPWRPRARWPQPRRPTAASSSSPSGSGA